MKTIKENDLYFLKNIYHNTLGCDTNEKLDNLSKEALHEMSERVNSRLKLILTEENKKIFDLLFRERKSIVEISNEFNLEKEEVLQKQALILRILRHPRGLIHI